MKVKKFFSHASYENTEISLPVIRMIIKSTCSERPVQILSLQKKDREKNRKIWPLT